MALTGATSSTVVTTSCGAAPFVSICSNRCRHFRLAHTYTSGITTVRKQHCPCTISCLALQESARQGSTASQHKLLRGQGERPSCFALSVYCYRSYCCCSARILLSASLSDVCTFGCWCFTNTYSCKCSTCKIAV